MSLRKRVYYPDIFLRIIPFLLVPLLLASCGSKEIRRVCMRKICVGVEVCDDAAERRMGLQFKEALDANRGMLFVFEQEGRYSFWMLNMGFPLDIIWINKDKKIVDISRNVAPCVDSCYGFKPKTAAQYVLEVNSGFCDKHNITIGQTVRF